MKPKTKIRDIYYLYHPNAVQDDTDPKGYRITGGGKWVVEWNVYTCPIKYSEYPEHLTKAFDTEQDAKIFYQKLMKRFIKEIKQG